MPRIIEDPTRTICPSFQDPEWEFLRETMITAHQGDQPLTAEEAAEQMKEAWTRENQRKVAAWNIQLEQDRAEQDEQDRAAREDEEARRALREGEAEEQRREAERKRPKLNNFDPDRLVSKWIEPRPAPYAITKLDSLEHVELDYFTIRGCQEAAVDVDRSISLDTLTLSQVGDTIAMRPLASLRPSKNIRSDEELS
jgi:hypothetical protein